MTYDPAIHHRKSIRLKGHDYAGGGVYFVTICAHRNAGDIFAPADVKKMVGAVWRSVGAGLVSALFDQSERKARPDEEGGHEARPYVVMPDHFHALIEIPKGERSLGDVVCAFKSRVVHEYISRVKAGAWPRFSGKIWHRNYYEMIVRMPEAEANIQNYIRMNPWKCVQDLGGGLRGMGNPALWSRPRLGVCCSRNAPRPKSIPPAKVYFGGFHSPMEKEIFAKLLELKKPVIWCPAWGLEKVAFAMGAREALEENRLLVLEMRHLEGDLAAAEQRNRFVLEQAEQYWLPHVTPGGMLDRLVAELQVNNS